MARHTATARAPLPVALDAEQCLLGALLFDNSAFALLPPAFGPEHFGEPLHSRMFSRMRGAMERGRPVDAAILGSAFQGDPAYEDLGGVRYVIDLIDRAPPGANAPEYAKTLLDMAVRRGLVAMSRELEERAVDPGVSPLELLGDVDSVMAELRATDTEVRLVSSDDAMASVMDWIDNPGGHAQGISTGMGPLDDHLGPWLPGDLIVLGARPSMGKSAVAAIIGQNVASTGVGVIEIHAEMSVEQAWRRRLTATAFSLYAEQAPAYSAIRKRTIDYHQREMLARAHEMLRGIPLHAVKRSGITLGRLRALVLRQKAAWERQGIPLGLITIDHVGLVKTDRQYDNRVAEQTEISGGLKQLADDLKVPVLALAQLNRQVEQRDDKRPTIADLRDSGSWEQDADVVLGAYREAYYASREKEPAISTAKGQVDYADWLSRKNSPWIEILLLKVREGNVGSVKLWGHMPTNSILGAAPPSDLGGLI